MPNIASNNWYGLCRGHGDWGWPHEGDFEAGWPAGEGPGGTEHLTLVPGPHHEHHLPWEHLAGMEA